MARGTPKRQTTRGLATRGLATRGLATRGLAVRYLVLILLLVVVLFGLWRCVAGWTPSRTDFPVQGISLTPGTTPNDWERARKDGVDFAYIVATEGEDTRYEGFVEAATEAEAAGVDAGALHIYRLCRLAGDQASNFIRTVARDERLLPTAVQFRLDRTCADHPSREVLITEIATFLRMVEAHMGKPVILKYDQDFEAEYHISTAIDRPLWLERTYLRPDYAPRGWALWQSSPRHDVAGIAGPVQWSVARPDQAKGS